jgi:hypothetical protein
MITPWVCRRFADGRLRVARLADDGRTLIAVLSWASSEGFTTKRALCSWWMRCRPNFTGARHVDADLVPVNLRHPLLRAAFIERQRLDLLVRRARSGKCPARLRDPMIRDALFCRYSTVQTVITRLLETSP